MRDPRLKNSHSSVALTPPPRPAWTPSVLPPVGDSAARYSHADWKQEQHAESS